MSFGLLKFSVVALKHETHSSAGDAILMLAHNSFTCPARSRKICLLMPLSDLKEKGCAGVARGSSTLAP